jgi:hypothetical protein
MSHLWWINHFGDFEIYDHQTKITILNHHFGDGFSHFAYHKKVLKAHSTAGRPSVHMRASNKLKQYRDKVSGTLW